jgi:ribosomal protein L11 methyltransferase
MQNSSYFSLTVDLPEASAEALESLLHDVGALGLEIRDSEAPPMPGVRGPSPGEAVVVAFFEQKGDAEAARDEVASAYPSARAALQQVENQDWSTSWRAQIRSVQTDKLWVGPPWDASNAPKGKMRIVIEPKMAFGTGDHPTTLLCLEAIERWAPSRPGLSVLDVGTGTGVLAIAARKLGASRVVATDNDPVSVALAKDNALDNSAPTLEISGKSLSQIDGTFDLVLANILANTLVELAPEISPKVKGRLFLAGILSAQAEEVSSAYLKQGLLPAGREQKGDWVRLDFRAPDCPW